MWQTYGIEIWGFIKTYNIHSLEAFIGDKFMNDD